MCAFATRSRSVCRGELHYCCVLVYCIYFVCESGGHHCADLIRYICRHSGCGCSAVYCCAVDWSVVSYAGFSVAFSGQNLRTAWVSLIVNSNSPSQFNEKHTVLHSAG